MQREDTAGEREKAAKASWSFQGYKNCAAEKFSIDSRGYCERGVVC